MRNSRIVLSGLIVLALALCARPAAAEDVATANVTVNLNLTTRTSLKVSSDVLHFTANAPGETVAAAVDFTAGARISTGCDLVLTVETLRPVEGRRDGAEAEAALSFTGEGTGVPAGTIATSQGTVVGHWQGSGVRDGRLIFTLRANAAGTYSLPVRFVLSTP